MIMDSKQKEAILKYWQKNGPSLLDYRLRKIYGLDDHSDWNEFRRMLVDYLGGIIEVDTLVKSRMSQPFTADCGGYDFDFKVKDYDLTNDNTLEFHESELYMIDDILCVIDPSGTATLFDGIEYTLFDLQHLTPAELQKKYGGNFVRDNDDLDVIFYELIDCVKETLYQEITQKYGVEIGGEVDIEEGKNQEFQSGLNENIGKIKKIMFT